jgi:hypothetical protein
MQIHDIQLLQNRVNDYILSPLKARYKYKDIGKPLNLMPYNLAI